MVDEHTDVVARWAARNGISLDDFEERDVSEFVCSAEEAAEILGVSVDQVVQLLAGGELYGELSSAGWIIARSSVEELRSRA